MIIEWLGFGHFYIIPKPILGFSIFMTIDLLNSPSGFIIGGLGLIAVLLFYQLKLKVDGISGIRMSPPLKFTQKKFNFSGFST